MQGVSICQVDTTHYSIQCSYLRGSDVSGCVYVLVSREEGVKNVTGFIERDNNGVTLEVANIDCYSEVLAYDSTTIDDILPVRTRINTSSVCPITTGNYVHYTSHWLVTHFVYLDPPTIITSTSPSSISGFTSTIIALISVVVVVVVVAVVLAVMLFIVSFMLYQNKGMGFRLCTYYVSTCCEMVQGLYMQGYHKISHQPFICICSIITGGG